jgi:tRNA threonylcarbamoyladenosine biosynthesis protein TsaE
MDYALHIPDEQAMVALGGRLARVLGPGLVVHLRGELGTGKTTLSRGLIQGLGHEGAVKSPTYTLVEPYQSLQPPVYHFDLYRLGDPGELEFMGIRDYLDGTCLCLIEWPERGGEVLPPADLVITIAADGTGRRVILRADTAQGEVVLGRLQGRGQGPDRE